ncbi:uncharacterized protein LOC143459466 isoform X2 [Clavelina lepadiformis]
MVKYKFLDVCIRIWDFCHTARDTNYNFLTCKAYDHMKLTLWNISDKSSGIAKAAFQNKVFIEKCMSEFGLPELDIDKISDQNQFNAVVATMGMLHNMAKHYHPVCSLIRHNGGLDRILHFYKYKDLKLQTMVMLLVAECITEEENDKIMESIDLLSFIVEQLKIALENPKHHFSASELVIGLDKLLANESNKKYIVGLNILPLLRRMLDQNSSADQMQAASHCIWTLSFASDNRNKICQEPDLLGTIYRVLSNSDVGVEIKRSCEGILFNIKNAQPAPAGTEKSVGRDKHVMISYQWNKQATIVKLDNYLKKFELKTWIDISNMQGSILESMAHAVEDASVVVIAMTEDYKKSNACRTEAEYAYKLRKPVIPLLLQSQYKPDGWLGAVLGMKLYVDLSNEDECEGKFPEVLTRIQTQLSQNPLSVSITDTDSPEVVSSVDQSWNIRSPKTWTSYHVKEWARKNRIADIGVIVSGFDGVELYQLSQLMNRCPKVYYTAMRKDYRLDWSQIFRLTEALENSK